MAEPTRPDLNGFFRLIDGEWRLIFGICDAGKLTLDPTKCAPHPEEAGTLKYHEMSEHGHIDIVTSGDGKLILQLDDVYMATGDTEGRCASESLPVIPAPENVAVIGLGAGTDVKTLVDHPSVTNVDVVEINQAIVDLLPYFNDFNDKPVNIIVEDAVQYFADVAPATYDAVYSDPQDATKPHATLLYKQETFETFKAALKPGGCLVHRLCFLSEDALAIFMNTLSAVFKHVVFAGEQTVIASDSEIKGTRWYPQTALFNTKANTLLEDQYAADKEAHA
ncbi:spermidine synthase [Amphritea sp. HPY]|uniref:spermidine synthase n=1 Tax=Amphritea sp. HPY TaxID=3421652 RepID=UPI003D7CCAE3